eukprot:5657773-Pleurochrysis_carterae.AAC.1
MPGLAHDVCAAPLAPWPVGPRFLVLRLSACSPLRTACIGAGDEPRPAANLFFALVSHEASFCLCLPAHAAHRSVIAP